MWRPRIAIKSASASRPQAPQMQLPPFTAVAQKWEVKGTTNTYKWKRVRGKPLGEGGWYAKPQVTMRDVKGMTKKAGWHASSASKGDLTCMGAGILAAEAESGRQLAVAIRTSFIE